MTNNKLTLKKSLLLFCYYVNIATLIFFVLVLIAALLRMQAFLDFVFFNQTFLNVRMILSLPIFAFWINNLIIWGKHDKHIGRFFLLFFLIGIYTPFYFRRVLRNSWQ